MDDQDQWFYRMNPVVLNFHMILLSKKPLCAAVFTGIVYVQIYQYL